MEIKDLQRLMLRLLGYYNDVNHSMVLEEENPEVAQELAELLSKTFDGIEDVNNDYAFKSAIENGVFILRDKESNLYAYFPKERLARVTNVEFNREGLTQLPLEYKNWFVPGEELVINEPMTQINPMPNRFFYDYLKSIGSIGHQIVLSVDYLGGRLSGELKAVGNNFIRIQDNNGQDFIISDHMTLCVDPTVNEEVPEQVVQQKMEKEDLFIPALGIITNFDKKRGLGNVRRYRDNATLGLRESELIDPDVLKSPVGKKVVFSEREETHRNGITMTQATFVHASAKASKMLQLAEELYNTNKKASTAVLEHILNNDPDHEEALLKLDEISSPVSPKVDEDTVKYKQAEAMLNDDKGDISRIEKAIDILKGVLNNGKKVKDTISLMARGYYRKYELETDDKDLKDIYRKDLYEHVNKYHSMLGPAASLNMRLNYYGLLDDKAYMETIDSILQESEVKNSKRAQMFFYKASYYQNHGDAARARSFAEESLYLRPFDNNAEKILIPELEELSIPKNGSLSSCLLAGKKYMDKEEDIDYAQNVELISKSDPRYNNHLFWAAIDSQETDEDRAQAFMTEYIASQALEYAHSRKVFSAIFYWSQLFGHIVPGFGYYLRNRFADFLAHVLNVDIKRDSNIETYRPWENRKSWDEILTSQSKITIGQWHQIFYAIGNNSRICEAVGWAIMGNEDLMVSFTQNFGMATHQLSVDAVVEVIKEGKNLLVEKEINAAQAIGELLKNAQTLEDLCVAMDQLSLNLQPYKALSRRNKELMKRLLEGCLPRMKQYEAATDSVSRKAVQSDLNFCLKELYHDILAEPTLFSIRAVWHMMTKIQSKIKINASADPEVIVQISRDNVVRDIYGYYEVRGEVTVDNHQTDAQDVKLSIAVKKGRFKFFRYEPYPVLNIGNVPSGATAPFSFRVKFDDDYDKPSFAFGVKCEYRVNNIAKTIYSNLEIHLISPNNERPFVPIKNNPYTYGQGLDIGDSTFVGRHKDIQELVNKVLHPQRTASQVILYGQKRCGKTTLVRALIDTLKKEHPDQAWCIYKTLTIDGKVELFSDRDFYRNILNAIYSDLVICPEPKPQLNMPTPRQMKEADSPTQLFCDTIMELKQSMAVTPGWEHKRLVLILDEFTLLYNSIKEGVASENILHNWKAIQESEMTNFVTIFVGHDISEAFLHEHYAVNAAAIIERYRLTYLKRDEAVELITRPTSIDGNSRFEKAAVEMILDYTGCSPYFLQMFMRRMVEYINAKEVMNVTENDVLMVAQDFISKQYSELSSIHDFDSLINCGLNDEYGEYRDKDIEKVLRIIAQISDPQSQWCEETAVKEAITWQRDRISKDNVEGIIKDLDSRNVVEIRKDENGEHVIRIIIGIFREWLLRN